MTAPRQAAWWLGPGWAEAQQTKAAESAGGQASDQVTACWSCTNKEPGQPSSTPAGLGGHMQCGGTCLSWLAQPCSVRTGLMMIASYSRGCRASARPRHPAQAGSRAAHHPTRTRRTTAPASKHALLICCCTQDVQLALQWTLPYRLIGGFAVLDGAAPSTTSGQQPALHDAPRQGFGPLAQSHAVRLRGHH